jgi:hypothetical protein
MKTSRAMRRVRLVGNLLIPILCLLLSRARAPESSAELKIKLIIQFAQDNSGIVLCYAQLHVQIVQTRLESSIKLRWVDITLISFSSPTTRPSQSRWKIDIKSVLVLCLLYTSTPGLIKTSTRRAMTSISSLKHWPGDAQSPPSFSGRSTTTLVFVQLGSGNRRWRL